MLHRLTLAVGLAGAAVLMFWTPWAAAQGSTANQTRPRLQCQENFKAMDSNHDGKVSEQEFMAFPHRRANADQIFQSMAQGKDYVTQDEFCANKGGRGWGRGRGGKGRGQGGMQ